MKRKVVFVIVGFCVFLVCFVGSVRWRDYLYEQKLRSDIQRVKIEMSENEVVEIIGKPSQRQMSDSQSEYWCYDTDSIARTLEEQPEIRCGHLVLEMSYMKTGEKWEVGRVIKVIGF